MVRKISGTLHQGLGMGIDSFDLFHLRPGQCQQTMLDGNDLLSYDIILEFYQQIIDLIHDSGGGILNGKYCEIRTAFINSTHGIPESFHMEGIDIFPEKPAHGSLGIRPLRSLVDHSGTVGFQFFHADKRKPSFTSVGG